MQLKESVAIITGAAKRVGKSIAQALARKGVHIVLHYNSSEKEAFETAKLLESEGVKVLCLKADLSHVQEIQTLVLQAEREMGKIDILVNAASQYNETAFTSITEGDWDQHLDVNVKGAFFLAQAAAKSMLKQKCGKIVNLIDAHITRPYTNYLPYFVSKSAMVGLTYTLARELAPHIQVNAISPGPVLMQPSWDEAFVQEIIDSVPLKRIGTAEDIANGVLFCLEGSDFMTGAIIPIDGGQRLR